MNGGHDKTQMGGGQEAFQTTHWTEIFAARTVDALRRRKAVGVVAARYWRPVYAFIRRKWHNKSNEDAKDLTQGFFEEVILGRELIQKADPEKGRFRSYLLKALKNYVISAGKAKSAKKRMPPGGLIRLAALESPDALLPTPGATPEQAFAYSWASGLLDEVLAVVAAGCRQMGQEKHWEVFRRTVVEPILTGVEAPPLSQLCRELSIESETRATNMNVTVKRRFRTTLEARVREFVDFDGDVEMEIHELMEILSKGGAG